MGGREGLLVREEWGCSVQPWLKAAGWVSSRSVGLGLSWWGMGFLASRLPVQHYSTWWCCWQEQMLLVSSVLLICRVC